jgi:hypothetical protein
MLIIIILFMFLPSLFGKSRKIKKYLFKNINLFLLLPSFFFQWVSFKYYSINEKHINDRYDN